MGRPFITTAVCCVFCFLCAEHSQCLFHHHATLPSDTSDETHNSLGNHGQVTRSSSVLKGNPGQVARSSSVLNTSLGNDLRTQRRRLSDDSYVRQHERKISSVADQEHNTNYKAVSDKNFRHRRATLDISEEQVFVKRLFSQFGEGDTMTFEGFERLLRTVGLQRLVSPAGSGHAVKSAPLSNIANAKLEANGKEYY